MERKKLEKLIEEINQGKKNINKISEQDRTDIFKYCSEHLSYMDDEPLFV